MFWLLIEIVAAVVLVVGWVTQIVIPMGRGEPAFPLFWSKQRRLEIKEKRLRQTIFEQHLEEDVDNLEASMRERRGNKHKHE